ncbi:hypothetical protein BGZ63DRAFT_115039 [Mariannaea sp. PMI_226]|nr:hypothetical protein BGZ63DRAFT_115039 [Mariannaea sp. PMI_226]
MPACLAHPSFPMPLHIIASPTSPLSGGHAYTMQNPWGGASSQVDRQLHQHLSHNNSHRVCWIPTSPQSAHFLPSHLSGRDALLSNMYRASPCTELAEYAQLQDPDTAQLRSGDKDVSGLPESFNVVAWQNKGLGLPGCVIGYGGSPNTWRPGMFLFMHCIMCIIPTFGNISSCRRRPATIHSKTTVILPFTGTAWTAASTFSSLVCILLSGNLP